MTEAESFVQRFADYWARPDLQQLDALLHRDVTLIQPLARPMHGLAAVRAEFSRIFALIPDLHGEVDRWGVTADGVLIELRLIGTTGGREISWPLVDRFVLDGARARERVTYFDPLPLLATLAGRPRAWARLARSGIWRSWLGG